MTGLARGVRLGMDIRDRREVRKDRERQLTEHEENRGMLRERHKWDQQNHQQNLDAHAFQQKIANDLRARNLQREELDALYKMSQIQDVIDSNLPEDKKNAFFSKIPDYMNTLHRDEMNAAGPEDLEQSFADMHDTEEGLIWTLDNKDKKTGKSYRAPMTWGRTRGGEDVAVQPWELVYGQIKAYRDVAQELGIYNPDVMQELAGIGLGKEKKKGFSPIQRDDATGLHGQYGDDGKFHPVKGGDNKKPAQIQTVEWIMSNMPNSDGSARDANQAWEKAQEVKSDRRGFIAEQVGKELEHIKVMGSKSTRQQYEAAPEAFERELIQKYDRIWSEIDHAIPSGVQNIQTPSDASKAPNMPDASRYDGQLIRHKQSGKSYRSVNGQWVEES